MSEFLTYGPSDFLLFSPRVYYRQFELHNQALWPAQIIALGLGVTLFFLVLRPSPVRSRVVAAILGLLWVWVGWVFVWQRYTTINWVAAYATPLFMLQGALLLAAAATRNGLDIEKEWRSLRGFALALLLFTLFFYPLLAPLWGRSWQAAEIFGIAPDPTALATLAVVALSRSRIRWPLMIVSALWCAITGATLWAMAAPDFWVAPICALVALTVRWTARRPTPRRYRHRNVPHCDV
jgi:hypothetical protein